MLFRDTKLLIPTVDPGRRRFVKGLALGGAMAGLGLGPAAALAGVNPRPGPRVLTGNRFDLNIAPQEVNFTGRARMGTAINGSVPAPVLRWREGERVTLNVTNNLAHDSSIHWHGIILPTDMDGVPGLSYAGIKPGETYHYEFDVNQSGTYWYHSHSGFQEQTGMYGAIVVDPREPDPFGYDRDYVVMLSDWSDEKPENIYAKLKKLSHYYNFNERTFKDFLRDVREKGYVETQRDRKMWGDMRMSDRDLSDVTGYTYTFLMNGQTPADGWTGLFKRGEKVRLRFINGAAMTFFDVRIPDLKMTVVATDGQNIEPVSVDEFRIGVAETFDVIVEPKDDRAYTLFAQAIDRSGFARGTLTPDPALRGEIPELDPVPILTHGDMGMGGHGGHAGHDMGAAAPAAMDHAAMGHTMPAADPHAGHDMGKAGEVDHAAMGHTMPAADPHAGHDMGKAMPAMDHSQHGGGTGGIKHAASEYGPHVDMRAETPQYRLDDPGVGLRNNGRRVLTYADIRNIGATYDPRDPEREIELHLTGNMSRYMWSINGIKFADAEPIQLTYGERVRITLVNDTMMNHPIHLHGMWSDLETGDDRHIPRKHTVVVQPGAMISYRVTADAKGRWAYHCHLLYHMPGMFREVRVS